MEIQISEEAKRFVAVQECLERQAIGPGRQDEKRRFLESIWSLHFQGATPATLETETTLNKIAQSGGSFDLILRRSIFDKHCLSTTKHFKPSLSPTLRLHPKTTSQSNMAQRSPEGYWIPPQKDSLPIRVTVRAGESNWEILSNSSNLSSLPRIIRTTEGWSRSPFESGVVSIQARSSPTIERVDKLQRYDSVDRSVLNAPVSDVCFGEEESNELNAQVILERLRAAGILLDLIGQDLRYSGQRHGCEHDCKVCAIQNEKAQPITLPVTKQDVLKRMEDQFRRPCLRQGPMLCLPVTPSSTSQRGHPLFPHRPHFISSRESDKSYASDLTLDDSTSWLWSTSDSEMLSDEKKRQVQHHFAGPPAYLLDSNRTDPVAVAFRNGYSKDSNVLSSIITGAKTSPISAIREVNNETGERPPGLEYGNLQAANHSNTTKRYQIGGGDGDWEERIRSKKCIKRRKDLDRLRAQRKTRDENEMYQGLKAFGGKQRGWNGENEFVRQKTLEAYHEEEDRRLQERLAEERSAQKARAFQKSRNSTSPCIPQAEISYRGLKTEMILAAKAKHLEEAYSERYAQILQERQDNDDFIEHLVVSNHKAIMKAPWDVDQIKRDALEAEKVRVETDRRANVRKEQKSKATAAAKSRLTQDLGESKNLLSKDLKRNKRDVEDRVEVSEHKQPRPKEI